MGTRGDGVKAHGRGSDEKREGERKDDPRATGSWDGNAVHGCGDVAGRPGLGLGNTGFEVFSQPSTGSSCWELKSGAKSEVHIWRIITGEMIAEAVGSEESALSHCRARRRSPGVRIPCAETPVGGGRKAGSRGDSCQQE